ncbi:hypothetical protein BDV93DRAFT_582421 [Ceratobasidium sp. AG-I]|nr:hypothetical protein BDV93DRAFT_582421 [Ceratobasidium sp. AG-I]
MIATTTSTLCKTTTPASQVILLAEPNHLIGMYKVSTEQVQPHPNQRSVNPEWVDSLCQRFVQVGIDRASHPIKVLLDKGSLESATNTRPTDVLELPSNITVLVYQGQHRIKACQQLDDTKEHWWYAEVYLPALETSHPAEFLTLMHSNNEEEFRLPSTDADRFLAFYRLRQMRDEKVITEEVYKANQDHLERGVVKDETRQGLGNLLRSPILSTAVASVLEDPQLRSGFNASTWGKKLVKGSLEVTIKPFQLSAASCEWRKLQTAAKKKNHPWKELPGGVDGALARVSKRPKEFRNVLNPIESSSWTFEHTALLPSVMTSETVIGALSDMYIIAQHFIHMSAGRDCLVRYTSRYQSEEEVTHPAGVIKALLGDRLRGKHGNYPDKVVLYMWQHRAVLLLGLKKEGIVQALDTTEDEYQALLLHHQHWWELLRYLKVSTLEAGLKLKIPRVFGQPVLKPVDQKALRTPGTHPPVESNQESSTHNQPTCRSQTRQGLIGNNGSGLSTADGEASDGIAHSALDSPSGRVVAADQGEDLLFPAPSAESSCDRPTKKRKVATRHEESEDEYFYRPLTPTGPDSEEEDLDQTSIKSLRCHNQLSSQLRHLDTKIEELRPDEAHALNDLIEAIVDLQGTGHMARVVGALSSKIELFTQRAARADRVAYDFLIDPLEQAVNHERADDVAEHLAEQST